MAGFKHIPGMEALHEDRSIVVALRHTELVGTRLEALIKSLRDLVREGVDLTVLHNIPGIEARQRLGGVTDRISFLGQGTDFVEQMITRVERLPETNRLIVVGNSAIRHTSGNNDNDFGVITRRVFEQRSGEIDSRDYRLVAEILRLIESHPNLHDAHVISAQQPRAIETELFTTKGCGTLITPKLDVNVTTATPDEARIVKSLLDAYRGAVKPRALTYIEEHIGNFILARGNDLPVGCVEKKDLGADIVELGALASTGRFLEHRIGSMLIDAFMADVQRNAACVVLTVTGTPKLLKIMKEKYRFTEITPSLTKSSHDITLSSSQIDILRMRMQKSPGRHFLIGTPLTSEQLSHFA